MAVVLVVMVVMIIVVIFVVENSPTLLRLEQLGVLNYLVPLRTQAKLLWAESLALQSISARIQCWSSSSMMNNYCVSLAVYQITKFTAVLQIEENKWLRLHIKWELLNSVCLCVQITFKKIVCVCVCVKRGRLAVKVEKHCRRGWSLTLDCEHIIKHFCNGTEPTIFSLGCCLFA